MREGSAAPQDSRHKGDAVTAHFGGGFYGGGGWPVVPDGTKPEPVLYETTDEEKREAGIGLQNAQSVMEAWGRLEKKGYTLARRTKPEVKK